MTIYEQIIAAYPELTSTEDVDNFGPKGCIILCDDADGLGAYIHSWNYTKPIPEGLKLGK